MVAKALGIYLVMFRVLNYENNRILYNYVYYPDIFINCLLAYLILSNDNYDYAIKEWGDYTVIVDNSLDMHPYILSLNKLDQIKRMYKNRNTSDWNIYDIINLIYLLIYPTDYNKMSFLFDAAYRKSYISFSQEILVPILGYYLFVKDNPESVEGVNINIIDNCIFVVKDLDLFIKTLKENNKLYNINEGPKNIRGQINSMKNFFSLLDFEFRESLYNHYISHRRIWRFWDADELTRSHFSFKNIHMRLGNIKF